MGPMFKAAASVLAAAGMVLGVATGAQAGSPTRISFAPGTTSSEVSGNLAPGGESDFVFGATAGQLATVHFTGPHLSFWTLIAPDGSPLHNSMSDQQTQLTLTLPGTGDYRLDADGGDGGHFVLDLTIPVRIRFAPGTTSTAVTGRLAAGGDVAYVFGAGAGQTATVHFTGPHNSRWVLVAPDGSPLHNGMTEQQRNVTVKLPGTGDYRLDVQGGDAGRYTLMLSIPAR